MKTRTFFFSTTLILSFLLFISSTSFLFSEQPDSLKIEQNVSSVMRDSTIKDSAKVDESYHLIAYVGGGVSQVVWEDVGTFPLANAGIEIPFTKENHISIVVNVGYPSIYAAIKFNFGFWENSFWSFHAGIGAITGESRGFTLPSGFSFTYKFTDSFSVSGTYTGLYLLILIPSISLNFNFRL